MAQRGVRTRTSPCLAPWLLTKVGSTSGEVGGTDLTVPLTGTVWLLSNTSELTCWPAPEINNTAQISCWHGITLLKTWTNLLNLQLTPTSNPSHLEHTASFQGTIQCCLWALLLLQGMEKVLSVRARFLIRDIHVPGFFCCPSLAGVRRGLCDRSNWSIIQIVTQSEALNFHVLRGLVVQFCPPWVC